MLTNPLISKAQRTSSAPNLEGTEWQVTTLGPYGSKDLEKAQAQVYAVYKFATQGQVTLIIIYIYATGLNPSMGPYDINTPSLTYQGIYRQNGNSIYLEFADTPHKINATISGNRMEGKKNKLVNKGNVKWINNNQFEIISTNNADGQGSVFKREGNNPNDYKSLNEHVQWR